MGYGELLLLGPGSTQRLKCVTPFLLAGCLQVSFTLAAACALAVAARHTPAGPAAAAAAGPSSPDAAAALSLAAHTLRHAKAAAAERAAAAAAAGRPPPPPDKCDMHVALMVSFRHVPALMPYLYGVWCFPTPPVPAPLLHGRTTVGPCLA